MDIREMNQEELRKEFQSLTSKNKKLEDIIARHENVKAAIMESSEGFQLFNMVPVGIAITSIQGTIIKANQALLSMFGYLWEEMASVNLAELYVNPEQRQTIIIELEKTGIVRDYEAKMIRKGGAIIYVLINSDYIELNHEKVIITSIREITKLKLSESGQEENAQQYYKLFINAPVGITVTDTAGTILAYNKAIQDLLGYMPEEFKKLSSGDFYWNKSERQQLLDATREKRIVRDFETSFKHKDGKPVAVLLNTDLINFGARQDVLLTSIRDISNLKHLEQELIKERDFTNAIINTVASLILVLDKEGRIISFNKACEKISGYSLHEIKEKLIWDVFSNESDITREVIIRLLAGGLPGQYETYLVSRSGRQYLISWTGTVLHDKKDGVKYLIATGIDITAQRQTENSLQEANEKLTSWVGELEEKNNDINLLGEMGGYLQGCQNINEACSISAQYIKKICPSSNGALYIINHSRDLAEAYEIWGEQNVTEKLFMPLNCWAVRRGRIHLIDETHLGLMCSHITGSQEGRYICIPMMAKGEVIGILHINQLSPSSGDGRKRPEASSYSEHKIKLLAAAAETIAFALSNLELHETMRQQSIRDVLTGLYNRRYMEESLTRELHRAEREQHSVGVIMFDIDHFKDFNDTYGHDGGDIMLHEIGSYLLKNTRGEDIVCRYGGEEFLVVFPNSSLENVVQRADGLRKGMKELTVYHLGKPMRKCSISIGVAVYPESGATADEVIKRADTALYRAKNEGRDRVVVAKS